jgi:F-type H+-transporting ATPase subunit delta
MLNDHRGIATAQVTSAVPLSQAEVAAVAARLGAMTGRKIVVEPSVDPDIMGGIVARIGDQLIDASVRGRLEALKRRLAAQT